MDELLKVERLKKYFPVTKGFFKKEVASLKAVDGVDFTIGAGETFGLVGESGCGKSTIGKLILLLYEVTDGKIEFDGVDIAKKNKKELREMKKEMQIVFQDPYGSLNPRMTVFDTLAEPIKKHSIVEKSQVDKRVNELLERVELSKRDMYKYPHEFSGGQRQRICIARALSVNPRLIVCDEPVSALDVSVQSQILNLFKGLQRELGIAYLFIAHGMPVVRYMSDRVGVMYLGKLVEVGSSEEIFTNQLHPYSKALMSAIPVADPDHKSERIPLKGEIPNPIYLNTGCRFFGRCPNAMPKCEIEMPQLVDVGNNHMVSCHLINR